MSATATAKFVDTVHVRLLVDDFAATFAFYERAMPAVCGATLAEGSAAGPYARWDTVPDVQPALALLDRAALAERVSGPNVGGDPVLIVFRVADTDAAERACVDAGAEVLVPATDMPEWGADVRNAYLRDPAGNLIELQTSSD